MTDAEAIDSSTSTSPWKVCDAVSVSGSYCSLPPNPVANTDTNNISPEQYHQSTALCDCEKKADGSQYNKCNAVIPPNGNESNLLTICANKFGCQRSLFPSMLGLQILTNPTNFSLDTSMCRCNGGTDYGLDVQSFYCNRFSTMYQRRGEIAYYTPSTRWNRARLEYDFYAMEIAKYIMSNITEQMNMTFIKMLHVDNSFRETAKYQKIEDDYGLLSRQVAAFTLPVQELACSVVYPRCARCQDILENPKKMLLEQEEYYSCFDPTTCRSLCKKVLKMHSSFSNQFQQCIIGGECKNATSHRIFHLNVSNVKFQASSDDKDELLNEEICHSEMICPWRSLPGHRQYDNPYDERNAYPFDPAQRSTVYLVVFGVVVVFLTFMCWFVSRYVVDIWKQRRQSGASAELRDDSGGGRWSGRHAAHGGGESGENQTSAFTFKDLQGGE